MAQTMRLTASDGHELDAYRVEPEGPSKGGLVVVQEIFGVNDHIRSVCDSYAALGYTVVGPALFDRLQPGIELGYEADDITRGRELKGQVSYEQAVMDVDAAVRSLADAGKVGVVGFCWGGSVAWLAATRLAVACAVGYYGGQIIDYVDEQPRAPIMLHFGDKDASIPMDAVERIRASHPDVPIHTYAAGHGFNCDRRKDFDPASAEVARGRTVEFFSRHLQS
ncbi:MAG: dienelactone hydrolase family protein [Gammaproteobacteria bacterium]